MTRRPPAPPPSLARILAIGLVLPALATAGAAGGCRRDEAEAARRRQEVTVGMKQLLSARLGEWRQASEALREAAPVSGGRGWDARLDAAALAAMKDAWGRGRVAYELIEGAVAPLFPESDAATDSRYDDFLAVTGAAGDPDAFDGEGVVGMHAIERILWADRLPPAVIAFERGLPGYRPAAFPASEAESAAFRDRLSARLVADIASLEADFTPLSLDVAFVFRGLVDLATEQAEKVNKAATGQEESRYAGTTMRDLRANVTGCREAYALFRPWLRAESGGEAVDRRVHEAFARLDAAYAAFPGDAMPSPPRTWSALQPAPADLTTPFGRLHTAVRREVDPAVDGSLVSALGAVAERLDLPKALLR